MDEKKKDIVEKVKEEVKKELEGKTGPQGIPFLNLTKFRFVDISSELSLR